MGLLQLPDKNSSDCGNDVRGSFRYRLRRRRAGGAALRIGFVPERVSLRPYFQLGGGVVTTTLQNGQSVDILAAVRNSQWASMFG